MCVSEKGPNIRAERMESQSIKDQKIMENVEKQ